MHDQRYVLVLVSLNPDHSDLSGNVYPEVGHIAAKQYKSNGDIRYGLYGTLWGQSEGAQWMNPDPNAQWRVVKIENNEDIVALDPEYNFVKFRSGMVVCSGSKFECCKHICTCCPNSDKCDQTECGLVAVALKPHGDLKHTLSRGEDSISETLPDYTHALNLGDRSSARTEGVGSHAITVGNNCASVVSGDESCAVVLGVNSTAVSQGKNGSAISISDYSQVVAGPGGTAIGLGLDSVVMTGVGGSIVLKYLDGNKVKLKVANAGEEIKADTPYHMVNGKLRQFAESPVNV